MEKENKHIEDLLYSYFAGDLSGKEQEELLRWLEADETHKKRLSEMADWWATAHVPLFASDMKADFQKHFGNLMPPVIPSPKNHWLNFKFVGKIAASVLIVVSVGAASYYIGKASSEPVASPVAYFETTTPSGARTKVVLPDQSVVWVNSGSTLRYANNFNEDGRKVQLDGEAYFEVTPDSLKPFVVKSKRLDIKVLGTSFNVKAYGQDEITDVTLVEGKVNVSLRDNTSPTGEVTLAPNRRLSFNKKTNGVQVDEVNAEDALAWMSGGMKFSDQTFASIAKDLERKFNVRIRIESDRLRKDVFSGSFTSEYSLDKILREVDVERRYTWSRSGDEVIIKDK